MKMYLPVIFIILSIWSCKDSADLSSNKEILAFTATGQTDAAIMISEPPIISLTVDINTDISIVEPKITISEKASISPASGESVDFSNGPVNYTVTAEDRSTKIWSVTVENTKSDQAKILSFEFERLQEGETVITDTNITIKLKQGIDLSSLAPTIIVSPKATIAPASLETVDFSHGPVIYTVTAENGDTQNWMVDASVAQVYEAEILSYTIPAQVGNSVFESWTINVEVPAGTDITNLIPTISTTEGTTIEPQSGVAVNFAEKGFVDYKVTTEIGTSKIWRVFVIEEYKKANHPFIQYMGRVDFSNPLKPRMHASGTSIITKFQGTYCQIIIDDQEKWGSNNNYIEIVVDGNQPTRIQTTGKQNTIDLVSGLTDGEHTLMITKDTEAGIGYLDFIGFRCDELMEPSPLPVRRIECIGNSITCGAGSDLSAVVCGAGEWYDQHNAYFAYGPDLARRLNAQWMLSSVSGIGLIHSCCDMNYTMPDVYQKTDLSVSGPDWDFSQYQADIVTVCLGQNDGIQDSVTFCDTYIDFLGTIRGNYPNASIICCTSPMADASLVSAQKQYLTGIVDYMNEHGDAKVLKYFFAGGLNDGCDSHPDLSQHAEIAGELETFINDNIQW